MTSLTNNQPSKPENPSQQNSNTPRPAFPKPTNQNENIDIHHKKPPKTWNQRPWPIFTRQKKTQPNSNTMKSVRKCSNQSTKLHIIKTKKISLNTNIICLKRIITFFRHKSCRNMMSMRVRICYRKILKWGSYKGIIVIWISRGSMWRRSRSS